MSTFHSLFRASQRAVTLNPDLRGRPVFDASGEQIGHVDEVLVEERAAEEAGLTDSGVLARYLEIGSGRRFHLRERRILVPMAEAVIETHGVRVNASRFDLFGPDDPIPSLPKRFDNGA